MFEITTKLKQKFCKDHGISLQLFKSPYFEDRIKLFDMEETWKQFIEFVSSHFETADAYFAYTTKLENDIVEYIKNSEVFVTLNADDMNQYPHKALPRRDGYKADCIGKRFISIDMKKANFSALVHYGKQKQLSFFDSYDYAAFVRKFTEYSYFAISKQMRQVVFGKCNAKRTINYQSYLMSLILDQIVQADIGITLEDIYGLNSDEILIQTEDETMFDRVSTFLKKECEIDVPLKVETYRIGRFNGTDAFVKLFDDGTYELKCVNPYEAPFIYRYLANQDIMESDTYFMFEKKLAKLIEIPEVVLIKTQEERQNIYQCLTDKQLDDRVKAAIRLELEKKKVMGIPISRYDHEEGIIYNIDSNGVKTVVCEVDRSMDFSEYMKHKK